jgi:hypothetical protein
MKWYFSFSGIMLLLASAAYTWTRRMSLSPGTSQGASG